MNVAALIRSFSTGTYTVTRRRKDRARHGRIEPSPSTTLTITASVSPSTGADLKRMAEGHNDDESRVVFTSTRLYLGGQGEEYEADKITIDGADWELSHLETWRDPSGSTGYRGVVIKEQ